MGYLLYPADVDAMSALVRQILGTRTDVPFTPKADMAQHDRDVRFVPL